MSRRTLLIGIGALAAIGSVGYWVTGGQPSSPGSAFASPLEIPPLLESSVVDGKRVFRLSAQAGKTELVPDVTFATVGFNGSYLGPTIRVERGEHVQVHVTNDLTMPTTTHWHGMLLPASQDGTPHQSINPGTTWTAEWQVDQPAATLWYHPHPHGQTELQVGRGMAGMLIVDDPEATSGLPSDYGVDDIPVIIQDVAVQPGGTAPGTPGSSPIGRIGNTLIVNGTHAPRFQATTTLVRFRILNASAARCYNLGLSNGSPIYLVGTDGGLLPAPKPLTHLLLSPAERAEILVHIPRGADLVLRSVPHDLGMSTGDDESGAGDTLGILRITGDDHAAAQSIPVVLPSTPLLERQDAVVERLFTLGSTTINGKTMDMSRIDTVVIANTTELWTVSNSSDRAHNFHVHGTQFAVHTVNGTTPTTSNSGRKDTVFLAPGDVVELLVPFGGFADESTPSMYHCHMLWHEDQGMMAQYIIEPD